jgi:hypothetical protein
LSEIVNFLKSLEFLRNIMYQMMQLKMHGFWAILYVCQEMVPSSQQSGCWATFSCSWGTKGGLTGSLLGACHTLQHGLATFQWHAGDTPVPLRAPCSRTQAIGPM